MEAFKEIIHPIVYNRLSQYSEQNHISLDELYKKVKNKKKDLHDKYFSSGEKEINYEDIITRLTYLYYYVPGLSECFNNILQRINDELKIFEGINEFTCLIFGGGPGTELISLISNFESLNSKNEKNLDFIITDKEDLWNDIWTEIKRKIRDIIRNQSLNISIDSHFNRVDLLDRRFVDIIENSLESSNFVFLNYVISELYSYSNFEHFYNNFERVLEGLPSNALIIVSDRAQEEIKKLINNFFEKYNYLEKVFENDFECRTNEDFLGELVSDDRLGKPIGSSFENYFYISRKK